MKVDGIEDYPFSSVLQLRKIYEDFIETSGGYDPDFPQANFGDHNNGKPGSSRDNLKFSKKNNRIQAEERWGVNDKIN